MSSTAICMTKSQAQSEEEEEAAVISCHTVRQGGGSSGVTGLVASYM